MRGFVCSEGTSACPADGRLHDDAGHPLLVASDMARAGPSVRGLGSSPMRRCGGSRPRTEEVESLRRSRRATRAPWHHSSSRRSWTSERAAEPESGTVPSAGIPSAWGRSGRRSVRASRALGRLRPEAYPATARRPRPATSRPVVRPDSNSLARDLAPFVHPCARGSTRRPPTRYPRRPLLDRDVLGADRVALRARSRGEDLS